MSTREDIEALHELQQSRGWAIFKELVMAEIAGDFEEHITRALDVQDGAIALDRMRQVAAVRKTGLRWLRLPSERIKTLAQELAPADDREDRLTRRPIGV